MSERRSPTAAPPASAPEAPRGVLFIVSAPSGAGKTSLVKALLARDPALHLAVSCTTRSPRPGEVDGVHYHFLDEAEFRCRIAAGAFVEHAEVFGNRYGTTAAAVHEVLDRGHDLLLEIDWQGARQVRARWPEAVGIFILPPSLAVLEERLRGRGQDGDAVIAGRMARACDELSHYGEYDYLVVNDAFDEALATLAAIAVAERHRRVVQEARLAGLLAELAPAPPPR
ncbi:guanylate kinase [Thiococcus pfennigii]|jgi:guanylate kinase|uniref:guanylate kinase n=1 Tax=Thiococcus pfennigii TaxID=1057 RepID=UPI0019047A84|nr:guanylate kinase [Thiococcus pfennigii]MBK1700259.1 guanylate kinase [Thiococcus pfennigii]MBK1730406.1 guanylate kinase [Thiococcus pfennigii]